MLEFRASRPEDGNSLKELWKSAFREKDQAIELFFKRIYTPDICFVALFDNKPVSMLYLLNTSVNGKKACYLYAAATRQDFRGRGIMRGLVDFALSHTDALLCATLPASEGLYDFYSGLGFEALTCESACISRKELCALAEPYGIQELVVEAYCGLRNSVLKNNFLFWNNNHIDFAFDYYSLYGAKVIKSNYGYAIAFEENNICTVSELICNDHALPKLFTHLLGAVSCDTFKFHLPRNRNIFPSKPEKYGMVRCLSDFRPDNIYMGLTLD